MEELTQEESKQFLLEAIGYLTENNGDNKVEKELLLVFRQGILVNLVRLHKEKALYLSYYIMYYLKTLGETTYYEDIFDSAFESIDFEKKIFRMLRKELKDIKKNKSYEKLFVFFEVIQELLKLDANRENKLVQELNEYCRMLEGSMYSTEFPHLPTNEEMEQKVLERIKVLTADFE